MFDTFGSLFSYTPGGREVLLERNLAMYIKRVLIFLYAFNKKFQFLRIYTGKIIGEPHKYFVLKGLLQYSLIRSKIRINYGIYL